MKKILLRLALILVIILFIIAVFVISFAPSLPENTNAIIDKVLPVGVPDLIQGDSGSVESEGLKIWYEIIRPAQPAKGTILLIMGLTGDALEWPSYFYQPLVDAGYNVIRFDNRDTGRSSWIKNWNKEDPYTLENMVNDAIAILDHLKIGKVHVVGMSMGGMMAQSMAINHRDRVITLTSVMSRPHAKNPKSPKAKNDLLLLHLTALLLKYGVLPTEKNAIKINVGARRILSPDGVEDSRVESLAEITLFNLRTGTGFNIRSFKHHVAAIVASGSRVEGLKKLDIPALVIHGKSDPLVPFYEGQKCASLIPNADSLWIEKMGHDIPPNKTSIINNAILKLISENEK